MIPTPYDFFNPDEAKIIELEKEYSRGIAEGKPLEEMKKLKNRITVLKSEMSSVRGNGDKIK